MYGWTVRRYEILVIRLQAITTTTHSARHRYQHHRARECWSRLLTRTCQQANAPSCSNQHSPPFSSRLWLFLISRIKFCQTHHSTFVAQETSLPIVYIGNWGMRICHWIAIRLIFLCKGSCHVQCNAMHWKSLTKLYWQNTRGHKSDTIWKEFLSGSGGEIAWESRDEMVSADDNILSGKQQERHKPPEAIIPPCIYHNAVYALN